MYISFDVHFTDGTITTLVTGDLGQELLDFGYPKDVGILKIVINHLDGTTHTLVPE